MDDTLISRRRADSATVAGDQLLLHHADGRVARVAVVVDQLDDRGLRTPLVEDILTAFPHAELHVTADLRAHVGTPVAGRIAALHGASANALTPRRFFRRFQAPRPKAPNLADYDVVLRVGDRRSRGFTARPEALDLTYILDLGESAEASPSAPNLGASLAERCALQGADVVWCGSRRIMATLRRRWQVDARLLYPAAELHGATALPDPRTMIVAAADAISPAWRARLATLARVRRDLPLVLHGNDASCRSRLPSVEPTADRFRELLPHALAVVLPPGDVFDARAVWAQQAGVPVIAATNSAAAETVEGLERREPTGVLLDDLSDEALLDAVTYIERHRAQFPVARLRDHAGRWAHERFRGTIKSLVFDAWCAHVAAQDPADRPHRAPLGTGPLAEAQRC